MATTAERLLAELDREMPTTRRLLERVPEDKGAWKPHPKSFALGHLAQLVADMPGWLTRIAGGVDIDLAAGGAYQLHSTAALVDRFDRNVREAREALATFKDEDFAAPWSLKMGDKVLFTDERGMVLRQTINHFSHHRGQLTVYLRLLDVPVPSIYGPTADEGWAS